MKIQSRKRSRKQIIVITGLVLVIVLAIGLGAYAYFQKRQLETDKAQMESSTIKEHQIESKTDSVSNLPQKPGSDPDPTPPSAEEPSTSPPEKPRIERASGSPTIKVVATFQKSSSGHCELQLSQPGQQTQSFTSSITVGTAYYSCSFSIARSDLPNERPWSVMVIHHIGSSSTSSDAMELQ